MRLLILMIYSDNDPSYVKMREIQRKYINKYENVDSYFIQSSYLHNEEVYIENDMCYVRSPEEHYSILYKTLSSLDCLTNFFKKEYDFVIRSNISTIINIPKLINLLQPYINIKFLYGGDICGVTRFDKSIRFALGTCIVLSKFLYKKMTHELNKFTDKIEDDVAIGLYIEENIPNAFNHNFSIAPFVFYSINLKNGWNSTYKDFIEYFIENPDLFNNNICFRNKTNDRNEDIKMMDFISDKII